MIDNNIDMYNNTKQLPIQLNNDLLINQDLEHKKVYSFTLNPTDNYFKIMEGEFDAPKDYANFIMLVIMLSKVFKPCCDKFSIYGEISPTGRLHVHGTVYIKDLYKWYRTVVPAINDIGFSRINKIDTAMDLIRWTMYIRKDWSKNPFPHITNSKSDQRDLSKIYSNL